MPGLCISVSSLPYSTIVVNWIWYLSSRVSRGLSVCFYYLTSKNLTRRACKQTKSAAPTEAELTASSRY